MKTLLILLAFVSFVVKADTLTLSAAVELGVSNNFSIRLARLDEKKSTNNKALKTGALLPHVRLDAAGTKTASHYFATSPPNALTSNDELKVGAVLNWTLFDGFLMFHAARQIDQQFNLAQIATRHQIESAVASIVTAYYGLIAQRSLLAAAEEKLALSINQLTFITSQYRYGQVGRRELLSQQVAVNSDSSALMQQTLSGKKALYTLNLAMGRAPDVHCICSADTTPLEPANTAQWWYKEALIHNAGLQMSALKKQMSVTRLAIAEASFWPVLSTSGSVHALSQNQTELLRSQLSLSLSMPILSGFTKKTTKKNSILDTISASLTIEESQHELEALIYEQFDRFAMSVTQIQFEVQAIERALESLKLTEEQFRLGRVSDVTLREAQVALLQARVRHQSALYQNRVLAVQLAMLGGKLKID